MAKDNLTMYFSHNPVGGCGGIIEPKLAWTIERPDGKIKVETYESVCAKCGARGIGPDDMTLWWRREVAIDPDASERDREEG